ncbi:digalactosyldiacylglycerol synthase 1 [Quercus suber]|uniref:Digalactosyldiacylglycerol synthase 1 n=1 Tax=Quercus suber TaxID=58331 RepID=A0AAW0JGP8_QUESU
MTWLLTNNRVELVNQDFELKLVGALGPSFMVSTLTWRVLRNITNRKRRTKTQRERLILSSPEIFKERRETQAFSESAMDNENRATTSSSSSLNSSTFSFISKGWREVRDSMDADIQLMRHRANTFKNLATSLD